MKTTRVCSVAFLFALIEGSVFPFYREGFSPIHSSGSVGSDLSDATIPDITMQGPSETQLDILKRTKSPDHFVIEITKFIKPEIEHQEKATFSIFGPISYYHEISPMSRHHNYWVKIIYDNGFMHAKVRFSRLRNNGQPILVEYQKQKSADEVLPPFIPEDIWFEN